MSSVGFSVDEVKGSAWLLAFRHSRVFYEMSCILYSNMEFGWHDGIGGDCGRLFGRVRTLLWGTEWRERCLLGRREIRP